MKNNSRKKGLKVSRLRCNSVVVYKKSIPVTYKNHIGVAGFINLFSLRCPTNSQSQLNFTCVPKTLSRSHFFKLTRILFINFTLHEHFHSLGVNGF